MLQWPSGGEFAKWAGCPGFNTWPSHTKDFGKATLDASFLSDYHIGVSLAFFSSPTLKTVGFHLKQAK